MVIPQPELRPIPVGLLKMKGTDLLVLVQAVAGGAFQPIGERLVEGGAIRLW